MEINFQFNGRNFMINGNRLKFGYGDIAVSSDGLTQRMSFQQFKPPAKCGDQISDDVEYIV